MTTLTAPATGMVSAMSMPVRCRPSSACIPAPNITSMPAVLLGAVLSAAIMLPWAIPFEATQRDILVLAGLGIFQLGLPCMLLVLVSRTLRAPEMALIGLLEIVAGPLWAWLGAGEVPAMATIAGGAIILAAVVANQLWHWSRPT